MSGIEVTGKWNQSAWDQADKFLAFRDDWDTFMVKTSKELADYAQEYFKPMLNVRNNPRGNGDTKESIQSEINHSADGFDIEYTGLLSAYYMDVGNFPAGAVLSAAAFEMKAFPVDARFGSPYFATEIHGMGHYTSGVPTHWSEKTATHLAEGKALEIAIDHFAEFLREVVIT
jgi:hypothetical protein